MMPILTKGSFSLNLGIIQLEGELTEEDRQCAWELYTELATRVAVTGKINDDNCQNFDGELYIESLSSLYTFFQQARLIMRKFPVGKLSIDNQRHLGVMISRVMSNVLRPFLEEWQVDFRHWWDYESDKNKTPLRRQEEYTKLKEFLDDWCSVRWIMRELQKELVRIYKLVEV